MVLPQVFSGHSGPVTAGAFTPDGKHVVSAGGENDCSLRVWNPKTGECSLTLQGHNFHQEGLTSLGVHQDGSVVISGAQDGSVCVSNIHNSRVVASLQGEEREWCVSGGRGGGGGGGGEGDRLCCGGVGIVLVNHHTHSDMQNATCCVSLLLCTARNCAHNHTAAFAPPPFPTHTGHEDSVEAAGFSRHLPLAATGSIDGKLIIWDCGTFTERGVCQHDDVSVFVVEDCVWVVG